MIIYGPRFFLWHEGINNNEKLRALNNHNVQIKQRYYYYNSFRRRCVFLCVLCFAVQILVTKLRTLRQEKGNPYQKTFFCFNFSQLLFKCFKFNVFVFINCLCLFIATNKTHSKKPNRIERIKDVTLQNLAGGKYIYVPPNFIHARKKCATTPF